VAWSACRLRSSRSHGSLAEHGPVNADSLAENLTIELGEHFWRLRAAPTAVDPFGQAGIMILRGGGPCQPPGASIRRGGPC
jgi:hypothetical protein